MQRYAWSEALATGVKSIDVQHRELLIAINDLADAIETGQGEKSVKKLLIFMQYYAQWHFAHEEGCANRYKCPNAAANKKAHEQFVEVFNALSAEYRESNASEAIARKMYAQLSDWLVNHIMKLDAQIGQCAQHAT
jgi:hemerythrin